MQAFKTFLAGAIISVAGFHTYKNLYDPPFQGLTQKDQELIAKFVEQNGLEHTTRLQISKALGLLHKRIYQYGLNNVLNGYKFNETYVKISEDREGQIKHLYCIFYPNQSLCWHPDTIHGGVAATMIDENAGLLCSLTVQSPVATALFNLKYLAPIKKNKLHVIQSKLVSRQGRQIRIKSETRALEDRKLMIESDLLFKTVAWGDGKNNPFIEAIKAHIPRQNQVDKVFQ